MNTNIHPKILIVSHNAFSDTQNNGKTLSSFFKNWNPDSLAQVYLTTDVPDFTVCKRFFQIHDIDMILRSMFISTTQGRRIIESDYSQMVEYKKKIATNPILGFIRRHASPCFRFFRDILWSIGRWKTSELKRFIDDINPEIVFFQASSGVFPFSIVQWICRSKGIPLVMQITDDYITPKRTLDPFYWIQHFRLKMAYRWAFSYSHCIIPIGDKMKEEYKLRFGGEYFVAMNSVPELGLPNYVPSFGTKVKFLYAGNLQLDRWRVLALIGDCLEELSTEEGLLGELSVYSLAEPNRKELAYLHRPPFIVFKGGVNTAQLNAAKGDSDVLVHVEAFDHFNKHITRLSISTKIPEYLASGRCILAVGPGDVASIEYIVDNDLGVVVTNQDKGSIKIALRETMRNPEKRSKYAENGLIVARNRHDRNTTAEALRRIIINATGVKKPRLEV